MIFGGTDKFDEVFKKKHRLTLIDGDIILHRSLWKKNSFKEWKRNWDSFIEETVLRTFADEIEIFITGENNFRDTLFPMYKKSTGRQEHRDNRGELYEEAKEYAKSICTVSHGNEADDDIIIAWYNNKNKRNHVTTIATIDKDMKQVSGWHYHLVSSDLTYVTPDEARRNFFTQLLTGDTVDNIPGLHGVGPVKAKRIVNSSNDCYQAVIDAYKSYHIGNWKDEINLQGALIWLQRGVDQTFDIELTKNKRGKVNGYF